MKVFNKPLSLQEILAYIGGEYQGSEEIMIDSVATAQEANDRSVIFVDQDKYLGISQQSSAGLIICGTAHAASLPGRNLLIVDKPYFALMKLVTIFQTMERANLEYQISPLAVVSPEAEIIEPVSIGAFVHIEAGAIIGRGSVLDSGVYVGTGTKIGADCHLYPHVTVYNECTIGDRVVVHSGAVIGADGFGFLLDGTKQVKIPQIGTVEIHSDVEIGANTTIDRATLGATVVGEGTKIDNQVQIGHNCVIGKHCILCAFVGLAGSTVVGDYVYLAGQVGAAGHLRIGDRVMVGAQSGITNDIPDGARFFGSPARDANTMKRIMAAQMSLPEIYKSYLKSKKED